MLQVLRGLLFENLGLKLVSLLLAVAVYLHVYTDRPASMIVSFPLQLTGLGDSLVLVGEVPATVEAELKGSGKQLIRLRLTEPRLEISLAGVGAGRFERPITAHDLPLIQQDGLELQRFIGPRIVHLEIERRRTRRLPVALRVLGAPGPGAALGRALTHPALVEVTGPASVIADLDSVEIAPVRVEGRRDTVRVPALVRGLPGGCTATPATVEVVVPIRRAGA